MASAQDYAAVLAENEDPKKQLNHDVPNVKKARLDRDCVSPLEDDDLLDTVLAFVGLKEYFFVAAVSQRWRGRYIKHCNLVAARKPLTSRPKLRTSYKSAVTTVAKLQLALDTTLSIGQVRAAAERFTKKAVRHSLEPVEVLALMHARCCDVSAAEGYAARSNKLHILQWMHRAGFPPFRRYVLLFAARGGSAPLLQWLRSHTEPWSQRRKNRMLWCAGLKRNLPAMQYLREQGAAWPRHFCAIDPCTKAKDCWSPKVSTACSLHCSSHTAARNGLR
jgi:hypothetical protein